MINPDMRLYDYYTYGDDDGYGMPQLYFGVQGKIKMAINIASQSVQDNILFQECTYIGLTNDANVDSTYVLVYGDRKLKVLYVNPKGRYKQVYLKEM